MSRWLVTADDDPAETFMVVNGGDDIDALTEASMEWGYDRDDLSVREWTAADERASRNAGRRERYAERRDRGELARPMDPEDAAAVGAIPMMAWLSLSTDPHGQPRCPTCGRWRRWRDFVGAANSARIGGACVDFAPSCRVCREVA